MEGGKDVNVRDVLFMTRTVLMDVLCTLYMSQCFSDHGLTYMYTVHRKLNQDELSTLDFQTWFN